MNTCNNCQGLIITCEDIKEVSDSINPGERTEYVNPLRGYTCVKIGVYKQGGGTISTGHTLGDVQK